ncbi:MAG: hypothetical protein NCW75_10110 [Phycisphaera sp.]|nr:MAG: hypothetical protein NCW75_10110 [Phycisphaera sp.]
MTIRSERARPISRPLARVMLAIVTQSLTLFLAVGETAFAQSCVPTWAEGVFCVEGLDWDVRAAVAFDDGTGEKLYVGGDFVTAGCEVVNHVAVWDGTRWAGLEGSDGVGVDRIVWSMAVYDDGAGPALYVGGEFRTAGGVPAEYLARWDGSAWSAVQGASGASARSGVDALHAGDDGSGAALFASTRLSAAGGAPYGVARWDGGDWSMVMPAGGSGFARPSGTSGSIQTIGTFDDGSGPSLYAGGLFETVDGELANNLARWDGTAWRGLRTPGGGTAGGTGVDGTVYDLEIYDDGRGDALYVGGFFREFERGATANYIVRWDGADWETLDGPSGTGTTNAVFALATFDDGQGEHLYAGGQFFSAGGVFADVARWDGAQWSAPPGDVRSDFDGRVYALAAWDGGDGPALFVGGDFEQIDTIGALRAARLRPGAGWESFLPIVGNGLNSVSDLLVSNEGGVDVLYAAAGAFEPSGEIRSIWARWTGERWVEPVTEGDARVWSARVMHEFDDGAGDALYLAGTFRTPSGLDVGTLARREGLRWQPLLGPGGGGATGGSISALAGFDDGTGPALYLAGGFTEADGAVVNRIAKWDGAQYVPLAGPAGVGVDGQIRSLAVFDDGNGPALYVAGNFTQAGGVPASSIARWDGSAWSAVAGPMGEGLSREAWGLAVYDDGSGPALYVGGLFDTAGGVEVDRIARWDGVQWTPLVAPGGIGVRGRIETLEALVDSNGPALYAGGSFSGAGGRTVNRIARWDGQDWSPLEGPKGVGVSTQVDAIVSVVEGGRAAVYAGGRFRVAGGVASSAIARWSCEAPACPADLDGDGALTIFDFLAFQNAFDAMDPAADFDGDGAFTIFDFLAFQNAFDAGCV